MTEAAIKARREYKRKWREANRDKVREYQERYWERLAAQDQANQAQPDGKPQAGA